MNKHIFRAKTSDGCIVKILFELLKNFTTNAIVEIDSKGMCIKTHNSKNTMLIFLSLQSEKFHKYSFNSDEKIYAGIALKQFHTSISEIKKKDYISLYIDEACPNKLNIKIKPRENNKIIRTSINIFSMQQLSIPPPSNATEYVIVQSEDYQRVIKTMNKSNFENKPIIISIRKSSITLKLHSDIMPKEIILGDTDDKSIERYVASFDLESLLRTLKITGLSSRLFFYGGSTTEPLMIQTDVGMIGSLVLYVKSTEQITMLKQM